MASKFLFRNSDSSKHVLLTFQRMVGGPSLAKWFANNSDWTLVYDSDSTEGHALFGDNLITNADTVTSLRASYAGLHIIGIKRNPYNRFVESLATANYKYRNRVTIYDAADLLTDNDMSGDADACWFDQCSHTGYTNCVEGVGIWLWEPQNVLYYRDSTCVVDTLFSFENFATEWDNWKGGFGITETPTLVTKWEKALNASIPATQLQPVLDSVTESVKTKIYNKFQDDFTKLGYASTDWTY